MAWSFNYVPHARGDEPPLTVPVGGLAYGKRGWFYFIDKIERIE